MSWSSKEPVSVSRDSASDCSAGGTETKSFKVVLRIRPLTESERSKKHKRCVEAVSTTVAAITKPEKPANSTRSKKSQYTFKYDLILGPQDTQESVFADAAESVVSSTLDGYNGTVIAYGQTGTGKTYTMEGAQGDDRGIIPRACEHIFNHIKSLKTTSTKFLVRVSFLQIYNEKITDLLQPSRRKHSHAARDGERTPRSDSRSAKASLAIREDTHGDVYVEGLSEHIVKSPADVHELVRRGQRARATAATKMNQASSRSHAVFTVIVEHSTSDSETAPDVDTMSDSDVASVGPTSGNATVTIGKLNLVDLAGSERVRTSDATDGAASDRMEEAKTINSSLSAFGKVVLALTSSAGHAHVPYRDSKLTRILQASLGGNCRTTLITTIGPSATAYGETLNSLKFAYRAKDVKNYAMVNQDRTDQALLTAYQREIKKLRSELHSTKVAQTQLLRQSGALDALQRQHTALALQHEQQQTQLDERERESQRHVAEKSALARRLRDIEQQMLRAGGARTASEPHTGLDAGLDASVAGILQSLEVDESADLQAAVARARRELVALHQHHADSLAADKRQLEDERRALQRGKEKMLMAPGSDGQRSPSPSSSSARSKRPPFLPPPASPRHARRDNSDADSDARTHAVSPAGMQALFGTRSYGDEGAGADVAGAPRAVRGRGSSGDGSAEDSVPGEDSDEEVLEGDGMLAELAHPRTGIPTTDLQFGEAYYPRAFTGEDAMEWFQHNIDGLGAVDTAMRFGQHLVNTGDLMRLDGEMEFAPDGFVYYVLNLPAGAESGDDDSVADDDAKDDEDDVNWNPYEELPVEPLHAAAADGDVRLLKDELDFLHVDTLDDNGRTALMIATMYNRANAVGVLLRAQSDVRRVDHDGRTALLWAAFCGHSRILKTLIRASQATVGIPDRDGRTALHWSTKHVSTGCIAALTAVSPPAAVNMQDKTGITPLHWAVLYQRPKHVARLLKAGANASIVDKERRTPLHFAVVDNAVACLRALLSNRVCVGTAAVNAQDHNGRTILHLAANNDTVDCMSAILQRPDVDVNSMDDKKTTPLHWAAVCDNLECCSQLVQYGADLKATDDAGMTARDHARAQGFDDCVALLDALEVNPMASIGGAASDHHGLSSSGDALVHRRNSIVGWRNGIAVPESKGFGKIKAIIHARTAQRALANAHPAVVGVAGGNLNKSQTCVMM
eukprot:m.466997 g.466997  ORF g.466997 m.466997 type:complete len:1197 (-) comp21631_c0_seq6:406-3996(-)